MSTKKVEYFIIPLSKRPKLYQEMQINPYNLDELELKKLLTYLDNNNEKRNNEIRNNYYKIMNFKYYSEFLNVVNSSIIFYFFNYYMLFSNEGGDVVTLFMFLDSSLLLFSMLFFLFSKQKQQIAEGPKYIILFGSISIIMSQYITNISTIETSVHKFINYKQLKNQKIIKLNQQNFPSKTLNDSVPLFDYIKLSYLIFHIPFLLINEYFPTTNLNISSFTILLYNILIFIMSIMHIETFMKIRCFLLGINIFEFIPEIRKFADSCSDNAHIITYIVNSILCSIVLLLIDERSTMIQVVIGNVLFIILYPIIFDTCYHKQKLFMKGMWDVPELTSFN